MSLANITLGSEVPLIKLMRYYVLYFIIILLLLLLIDSLFKKIFILKYKIEIFCKRTK